MNIKLLDEQADQAISFYRDSKIVLCVCDCDSDQMLGSILTKPCSQVLGATCDVTSGSSYFRGIKVVYNLLEV